jgi:hypothetical protein
MPSPYSCRNQIALTKDAINCYKIDYGQKSGNVRYNDDGDVKRRSKECSVFSAKPNYLGKDSRLM